MSVITLLSDFGLKDPYVAEMKAVILSICPDACIVDVSHEVEKFNVRMGACVLASAAPYFSEGTIHVAVVDPGVGTKRRPIAVETKRAFYVGPDNGVLSLAAVREGIRRVCVITNLRFVLPRVSATFHGRDVFAPAAAHLARGCKPSDFGSEISDYVVPRFAKPRLVKGGLWGEVLHVDDFGNVITNVSRVELEKAGIREGDVLGFRFGGGGVVELRFCSTYGDVSVGESLALIGGHDFLEVSVNRASACERFGVRVGDGVVVLRGARV